MGKKENKKIAHNALQIKLSFGFLPFENQTRQKTKWSLICLLWAVKITIMELPKEFDARPIDVKSGWKNNAKILAEIVTAINNEIYVEDESAEMEKIDIVLEWLRKHKGK